MFNEVVVSIDPTAVYPFGHTRKQVESSFSESAWILLGAFLLFALFVGACVARIQAHSKDKERESDMEQHLAKMRLFDDRRRFDDERMRLKLDQERAERDVSQLRKELRDAQHLVAIMRTGDYLPPAVVEPATPAPDDVFRSRRVGERPAEAGVASAVLGAQPVKRKEILDSKVHDDPVNTEAMELGLA